MILFFGTRPGKQEKHPLTDCACPYCHQLNSLTLYSQANYFHIFWIKMFKISSSKTAECNHCKRAYYENEFTEQIIKVLENRKTGPI